MKAKHPWTNGQVERMNRTIKDATVKRFYYECHDQLRQHLADFDTAARSPISFGNPRRRGRARRPFLRISLSTRCKPQARPSASTSCQTR